MKHYYRVLTIAGSDSGGGAGIQADLKTFSALGCYGMSVITALTAQNTHAVTGIFPVSAAFVSAQIDAVMSDIGADAVKIGMLHSAELIAAVTEALKRHGVKKIVLDPVMVSKSGDHLLQNEAVDALRTVLLPLATVLTPNLPEASVLLGRKVDSAEDMEAAARDLAALGPRAVLLKGGHLEGKQSPDLLYRADTRAAVTLEAERIDTPNSHGTGCTLSSGIAAGLARGLEVEEAVRQGKAYISEALKAGALYQIGHGHGPVHHFWRFWD
ncbi:hydroxymethylpyrimidine/phosphomethylpyrimidine kinase [Spirochaetia bacterium]|nr:hydroxymethylpyrimidine/phosphomethylpyrimidine kinase [Spirochaetia bacterium]